jgi:CRP/FNR family transcriptional regulator, cyclic AMP receptor protein
MTGGLGAYINAKEAAHFRGILANSVIFNGLDEAAVDQFLNKGMILEAKKGNIVAFEKMPGGIGLYVILEGKVDVFRAIDPERLATTTPKIHLNTMLPGQCFGEYSLLDGLATSASAMALEKSRLYFLPRGAFLALLEASPEVTSTIYRNLLLFLIKRLRIKDEELNAMR